MTYFEPSTNQMGRKLFLVWWNDYSFLLASSSTRSHLLFRWNWTHRCILYVCELHNWNCHHFIWISFMSDNIIWHLTSRHYNIGVPGKWLVVVIIIRYFCFLSSFFLSCSSIFILQLFSIVISTLALARRAILLRHRSHQARTMGFHLYVAFWFCLVSISCHHRSTQVAVNMQYWNGRSCILAHICVRQHHAIF